MLQHGLRMPITTKAPVKPEVKSFNSAAAVSCVFDTKEEFIAHLIRTSEIQKDPRRYNDGLIHLCGTLKIDRRVKKGLNWNDVVATSAIVERGQISRYQYLPLTVKGVKTALAVPDLKLYMRHNNYNAVYSKGRYKVDLLRISEQASHLDFSSVSAKLTLFYGQKIALSKLPRAENIFGLSPSGLDVDCTDAYRIARQKGCGTEVLNELRPRNVIVACLSRLISRK